MKIEDKAELADYEDAWFNHPITLKRRKDMEERRLSALGGIINAASISNDPAVRAALAKYREVDVMVVALGGKRFAEEVR